MLAALPLIVPVHAESTSGVTFRIERGDTYMNLFGADWEKAYHQNKTTVVRSGRPVTSPDILVEGSILTVSRDVHLSARALARLATLQRRREQLKARLVSLGPTLSKLPEAQAIAVQCRDLLNNDLRFAADVEFAEREVAHLERLARGPMPPNTGSTARFPLLYVLAVCLTLACISIVGLWRRARPRYPEGSVRYQQALSDVKTAFKATGLAV
ncbi:MAG TPA: hypothetical protein VIY49_21590 [Bryobacteraceae bacterium]